MNSENKKTDFLSSKMPLLISLLFNAILIVVLIIFVITRTVADNSAAVGTNQNNNSSSNNITSYPLEQVPLTQYFYGKFINSKLPENWKIVEYSDNSGMQNGVSNVQYTGFTGMDVIDELHFGTIFSLRGVDGVGGGPCTDVSRFQDTDQSYINNVVKTGKDAADIDVKVNDLTASTYSKVNLMGLTMRRIGDQLYNNESNDAAHFNPSCGVGAKIIGLSSVGFAISAQNTPMMKNNFSPFEWKINVNNDQELATLDEILNSITVK